MTGAGALDERFRAQYLATGAPRGDRENATTCIAWMTKYGASYANAVEVLAALDPDDPRWPGEMLGWAHAVCRIMEWPQTWGDTAAEVLSKGAQQRFNELSERLEKQIRRLAYERAPGDRMLRIVADVTLEADMYWPAELAIPFCRRIARATLPRSARARG